MAREDLGSHTSERVERGAASAKGRMSERVEGSCLNAQRAEKWSHAAVMRVQGTQQVREMESRQQTLSKKATSKLARLKVCSIHTKHIRVRQEERSSNTTKAHETEIGTTFSCTCLSRAGPPPVSWVSIPEACSEHSSTRDRDGRNIFTHLTQHGQLPLYELGEQLLTLHLVSHVHLQQQHHHPVHRQFVAPP